MPILRDKGVVLRRYEYSETSQVLVFFTRAHGKVRMIAKGIKRGTKKRFAAAIDLLDVGHVAFSVRAGSEQSLAILTEWQQTRAYPGLREKLERIQAGRYTAEVTAMLTEDGDPHPSLYDALSAGLKELEKAEEVMVGVVDFQRRLLSEVGSMPRFDACVQCQRAEDLAYFSSLEGGMICKHCEAAQVEKRYVTAEALDCLRGVGNMEDSNVAPVPRAYNRLIGAFDVLNYHIAHLAGRQPLSATGLLK